MTSGRNAGTFAVLLMMAGSASAESLYGRYSLGFYGGRGQASYSDINSFFDAFNEHSGILENNLQEYNDFGGGSSYGVDVRHAFTDNFVFGARIGFMQSSISVEQDWIVVVDDGTTTVPLDRTVSVQTVPLTFTGYYYFPVIEGLHLYTGAGIGLYNSGLVSNSFHDVYNAGPGFDRGKHEFSQDPFGSGDRAWRGTEIGYQVSAGAEYALSNHLALSGEGIFRVATIRTLKDESQNPSDGTGRDEFRHIQVVDESFSNSPVYVYYHSPTENRSVTTRDQTPVELNLTGLDLSLGLRLYF